MYFLHSYLLYFSVCRRLKRFIAMFSGVCVIKSVCINISDCVTKCNCHDNEETFYPGLPSPDEPVL